MRSEEFWNWFDTEARPKLTGRADTFAKMFEHLDRFDGPLTIVETGCVRKKGNWGGDGQSTILFDHYVQTHLPSIVCSVDINPEATALCRELVSGAVHVTTGDSVEFLRNFVGYADDCHLPPLRLAYLDSYDLAPGRNPIPAALHHVNELMALLPALHEDTLVVVDDSPPTFDDVGRFQIGGKGMFVAQYAMYATADLVFSAYQVGWTNMAKNGSALVASIEELVERARSQVENKQAVAAGELYRIILGRTSPPKTGVDRVAHGEACAFFARYALTRRKFGEAADWYRQALDADPLATDYRIELCIKALLPMGALKQAQVEATRATLVAPDYPETWRTLGGMEHQLGNLKASIAAYDKQLAMLPDDPNALLDRATVALDTADYALVRGLCEKVLNDPRTDRHPDAWHCLGMVAYRENRHEEAIELYDKAIAGNCYDVPIAHWNKALSLHSIGRYKEGWVEHEQREFQQTNFALSLPMRRFTLPRWKGEPPPASIHVHSEAGMGDNLCLARYLPMIADRGYTVRYETHEGLVDIMRQSFPEIEIMTKAPDYPGALGIRPFDYHIPMVSLPAVFNTEIETVPWNGPYLKPDPKLVRKYERKLSRSSKRKIGLCWSSGIREGGWISEYGRRKSMYLAALEPVFRTQPDDFYSLQIGPERAELDGDPHGYSYREYITDLLPDLPTWSETASFIECLDLVITVDTAVAHLAGAMGKPVWLMMHQQGSWHWMIERPGASWNTRSPWYPSVRIFRQKKICEWGPVVTEIREALQQANEPELALMGAAAG